MTTETAQTIQRALIITCGETAQMAGERLKNLLSAPDQPQEAIGIVPATATDWGAGREAIANGMRQVSQTSVLPALAERGWQLDRVGEMVVYWLVELRPDLDHAWVKTAVKEIAEMVRGGLGIETTALLVALAARPVDQEVHMIMSKILSQTRPFSRGAIILSLVNEAGLQLAGAGELADTAAQLLQALAVTPLRDAPEWLAERSGWLPEQPDVISSAGLSIWEWRPAAEQQRLARLWARLVLTQWQQQADDDGAREMGNTALAWLDQQACGPQRWRQEAAALVGTFAVPSWAFPQPWQVGRRAQTLQRLAVSLQEAMPESAGLVQEAMEPDLTRREASLRAACRQRLDETPVAGVDRCHLFLQAAAREVERYSDEVAGQQEAHSRQAASLLALYEQFQKHMEDLLALWPGETGLAWLKAAWQPWRWPALVWRYWQMQTTGQQMTRMVQQMAQLEQQRVITAVLMTAYDDLLAMMQRLTQQVEEVGEMLACVQQSLADEPDEGDGKQSFLLYEQFAAAPALEATEAAAAVGGLGRQLAALDDAVLDDLLAVGLRRFQTVADLTAADVLARLYPSKPAMATWWQEQWQEAAPLWRYDEAQMATGSHGRQSSLAVVGAAGAMSLKERLGFGDATDVRWLETADRQNVLLLRLRTGLAVSVK